MAKWIPPKIDYWDTPRPIGGEDLKRIEGNLQHLKDYCLFWYEPSDELLIESVSEKMVRSLNRTVMKSFRLQYPGVYKITFQARRAATGGGYWRVSNAAVFVFGYNTGTLTTDWKTFTFTTQANANTTYNIEGYGKEEYYFDGRIHNTRALAVYIRNVQIFASPVRLAVPASFIIE